MNKIITNSNSPRKKNRRKKINRTLFPKIDLHRNLDQFNSPQIRGCRKMSQKYNYKYNCREPPLKNLMQLNFIECNQIQEPNPKWKSLKNGYLNRANLIWDIKNCYWDSS